MIYPPVSIITLRLCEILDSTFFTFELHTFRSRLHILVGLDA